GDAQALLLATGQRQPAVLELVLDLVPERGLPEGLLDPIGDLALEAIELEPERHVVEDAHRERIWLLEDHADVPAHGHRVDVPRVDVLALEVDVSLKAKAPDEVVHAVQAAQHGALAAAGRPDEPRDHASLYHDVAVAHGEEAPVDLIQLAVDHDHRGRGFGRPARAVSV